ncbi:peptide ABC transporter substrate-binding protein, partial [Oenococcus oeni IOEB_L18_3]
MARKKKMSTGKKVGITALAAVIVIGGVAGYATLGKKSTTSNVLNEYLPVDMTTQDLSQMTDSYAFEVAANVQQGLLSRTSSGAPKAGL